MKKVCLFNFPRMDNFHGFLIDSLDPMPYFGKDNKQALGDLIWGGWNQYSKKRNLMTGAEGLDRLYRQRDPSYIKFLGDFVDKFRDYDVIVMSTYNCVHPEILCHELEKPIKILGFIDDPYSTYARGIPFLWAFDGAFYISPSYNAETRFDHALEQWGCSQHYWWPLCPPEVNVPGDIEPFFEQRDIELIYVGMATGSKVDRLIKLKKHFGSRFRVHGRWPLKGCSGMVRGLFGKPIYWGRVSTVSNNERTQLYLRTKIGVNMHVSDRPTETGNMRMYELPAHGIMMVCDKAGLDAHEEIFVPNREAVYYDSMNDAIDKIEYYLARDEERTEIAHAGFERVQKDYRWEENLLRFLGWAIQVPKRDSMMTRLRHACGN